MYQVSNYGCVRSLKNGKVRYLKNTKNIYGYETISLCYDGNLKQFRVHRLVYEAFNGPIPDGMEIDHINTVRDDNRLVNLRCVTRKENCNNPITKEHHIEAGKLRSQNPEWHRKTRDGAKKRSENEEWRIKQKEGALQRSKKREWRKNIMEAANLRSKDPVWLAKNREAVRKACAKPILQLDKSTGEVIREWECQRDIERELGINQRNISACCLGKRKSTGGFKWKFAS